MLRYAAWLHVALGGYLWLIEWIPLGNWNRQQGDRLLVALLKGHGIETGDLFGMAFVAAPAVLFWIAYRRRARWFAVAGLALDLFWLWMQIQSWWIPYLFGATQPWQIRYAQGPTTKVLPSFGNHVAPDGMHFAIHVLLVAALMTGIPATISLFRRSSPYVLAP